MIKRGFSFAPGYRLEQFLGKGQFGQVWRASAPGGAAAAIKFIDLSGSEGAKEHEGIKRVKQIRHANLMPITAIWLLDKDGKPIEDGPEVELETTTFNAESEPAFDPLATADSLPSDSSQDSTPGIASSSFAPLDKTGYVQSPQAEPAWLVVAMLLGGLSLQQRLRDCIKQEGLPGIPAKELLAYIDESAKGLDFLNTSQHDLGQGIVAIQHCDVKPANIVLIGSSAVVCDFGLARILSRAEATQMNAAGTPAYMAPESFKGKPSRTSDQYSLAVTYYHLRTGKPPVEGKTTYEIMDKHLSGSLDMSGVTGREREVLKRATALDWNDRFDSNGDFVDALREALRTEGVTKTIRVSSPTVDTNTDTAQMPQATVAISAVESYDATVAKTVASDALPPSPNSDDDAEVPIVSDGNMTWWMQPHWLAIGSIAIVAPMLLLVLFAESNEKNGRERILDSDDIVVTPPFETPRTVNDYLSEATQQLPGDFEVAKGSFLKAVELEPSLLTPKPILLTGLQGQVLHLSFSGGSNRDDSMLVAAGDGGQPAIWSLEKGMSSLIGETAPAPGAVFCEGLDELIDQLVVSPSGEMFAASDQGRNVVIASFAEPTKPIKSMKLSGGYATSLAWRPDGSYLFAATSKPGLDFFKIATSRAEVAFRLDVEKMATSIAFDSQGKWLFSLRDDGVVDRTAWSDVEATLQTPSVPTPELVSTKGTRIAVMLATAGESPSTSALVTGGENGEVTLWTIGDTVDAERQSIHADEVTALAATPAGIAGVIASGDASGVVGVWFADRKRPILKLPLHAGPVTSIVLSTDGRWLASCAFDGDVVVLDLSDKDATLARLTSGAGEAHCVAMDAAGRYLAVGHNDGNVMLWDLRHAKLLTKERVESSRDLKPIVAPEKEGRSV